MHEVVGRLALDLRGLTVVTEAGSGVYSLTPVIAALAGADHVRALTRNSAWGSAASIRETLEAACALAGLGGRVEITESRSAGTFADADIITNLGFARPIDAEIVEFLKPSAVVTLMCEAWEVRPGDVDLEACHRRGILVLGTNEDHPLCDVFRYSGPLAGKLLLEAGFELLGVRVLVMGRDRFAPVIVDWLERAGAMASPVEPDDPDIYSRLANMDVLMVADYASDACLVGDAAPVDVTRLRQAAPTLTVVQFAGVIDSAALDREGVSYSPPKPVPARRMVRTFSDLGPVPTIRLHAGGLKVGELGARARLEGLAREEAEARAVQTGLAQPVGRPTLR